MALLLAVIFGGLGGDRRERIQEVTLEHIFFLMLAFGFLLTAQAITLYQDAFFGGLTIAVLYVELHVVQFLELLRCISPVVALFKWSQLRVGHRETLVKGLVVALAVSRSSRRLTRPRSGAARRLPPGCSRQPGGFLIVTSDVGYNDSVSTAHRTAHGP